MERVLPQECGPGRKFNWVPWVTAMAVLSTLAVVVLVGDSTTGEFALEESITVPEHSFDAADEMETSNRDELAFSPENGLLMSAPQTKTAESQASAQAAKVQKQQQQKSVFNYYCPPLQKRAEVQHVRKIITPCGKWYQMRDLNHRLARALTLGVRFRPNKVTLADEGRETIRGVAHALRKYDHVRITVTGVTPETGEQGYKLAKGRAETTAIELRSLGVKNNVTTVGITNGAMIGIKIRATGSDTFKPRPSGCTRDTSYISQSTYTTECVEDTEKVHKYRAQQKEKKEKEFTAKSKARAKEQLRKARLEKLDKERGAKIENGLICRHGYVRVRWPANDTESLTPCQAWNKRRNLDFKLKKLEKGISYRPNEATLDENGMSALQGIANELQLDPRQGVTVIGESPLDGKQGRALGGGRARSAVRYLQKLGVTNPFRAAGVLNSPLIGVVVRATGGEGHRPPGCKAVIGPTKKVVYCVSEASVKTKENAKKKYQEHMHKKKADKEHAWKLKRGLICHQGYEKVARTTSNYTLNDCGLWFQEQAVNRKLQKDLFHRVHFSPNTVHVSEEGRTVLHKVAATLTEHPTAKITVIGETPVTGYKGHHLASTRAAAAVTVLQHLGVKNPIEAKGMTDTTKIAIVIRLSGSSKMMRPHSCTVKSDRYKLIEYTKNVCLKEREAKAERFEIQIKQKEKKERFAKWQQEKNKKRAIKMQKALRTEQNTKADLRNEMDTKDELAIKAKAELEQKKISEETAVKREQEKGVKQKHEQHHKFSAVEEQKDKSERREKLLKGREEREIKIKQGLICPEGKRMTELQSEIRRLTPCGEWDHRQRLNQYLAKALQGTIRFWPDTQKLMQKGKDKLISVAAILHRYPKESLEVLWTTEEGGLLGERRAQVVKDYLQQILEVPNHMDSQGEDNPDVMQGRTVLMRALGSSRAAQPPGCDEAPKFVAAVKLIHKCVNITHVDTQIEKLQYAKVATFNATRGGHGQSTDVTQQSSSSGDGKGDSSEQHLEQVDKAKWDAEVKLEKSVELKLEKCQKAKAKLEAGTPVSQQQKQKKGKQSTEKQAEKQKSQKKATDAWKSNVNKQKQKELKEATMARESHEATSAWEGAQKVQAMEKVVKKKKRWDPDAMMKELSATKGTPEDTSTGANAPQRVTEWHSSTQVQVAQSHKNKVVKHDSRNDHASQQKDFVYSKARDSPTLKVQAHNKAAEKSPSSTDKSLAQAKKRTVQTQVEGTSSVAQKQKRARAQAKATGKSAKTTQTQGKAAPNSFTHTQKKTRARAQAAGKAALAGLTMEENSLQSAEHQAQGTN